MGRHTDLRVAVLVGGDSMEAQFAELAAFPDVLVATPGAPRLLLLFAVHALWCSPGMLKRSCIHALTRARPPSPLPSPLPAGRLMHHLQEVAGMSLRGCEYLVFDEADRLFEMGFAEQLREVRPICLFRAGLMPCV